jgi:hypothetical protein
MGHESPARIDGPDSVNQSLRIVETAQSRANHVFDEANNVEPCRTVAKRIAGEYDIPEIHPLVDSIAHAIEDARELGEKRGRMLTESGAAPTKDPS